MSNAATDTTVKVETFDEVFATDTLASQYKAFGSSAAALWDSADDCVKVVRMGMDAYDLMKAEKSLNPSTYDRAKVIEKLRMAMVLCGAPIVMTPQEIVSVFWAYQLDRSIAGDENRPRAYRHGIDADWFGGNITVSSLRVLDNVISRATGKDEVDVWEYETGWEAWSRTQVNALRTSTIGVRHLEAMAKAKAAALKLEKETAARSTMSAEQIAAADSKKLAREKEAKHAKLKSIVNTMQDYAQDELKMDKDEIARVLVNKGVIPPAAKLNNKDYAKNLTSGDAKALVECIVELMPSDPGRFMLVLKTLARASAMAVKASQPPADAAATLPLAKTG